MSRIVPSGMRLGVACVAMLVLVPGCSDRQPTDVLDSINLAKGGNREISYTADLTMSGGMTASGQVLHARDGEKTISMINDETKGGGRPPVTLELALTGTHNAGYTGGVCALSQQKRATPDFDMLFDKLVDASQPRSELHASIDKTALGAPSEESGIGVGWEDEDGTFLLSVGNHDPHGGGAGASTVTMTGDLATGLTITFTGGSVRVRDWTGSSPQRYSLTCPLDANDAITVVLVGVPD